MKSRFVDRVLAAALLIGVFGIHVHTASAQVHPAVPAFSSAPGAAYTLYLDFAGFSFNGNWGGNPSSTPGVTPAYTVDGNASTFNATELANIKNAWSRVSEKFSPFSVNVTTVDPAPAVFLGNDANRQAYYDSRPRTMHTVIGGSGGWSGGGGVSYVGVAPSSTGAGVHTNWMFSAQAPSFMGFVAEGAAHENGHAIALSHQSDYSGTTLINEYSLGTGTGAGSEAPIMGNPYYAERAMWKVGPAHVNDIGPATQNDAYLLASAVGMGGFINDGIGHTLGTATPLPLSGLGINAAQARGVIVSDALGVPTTFGANSYTSDYWSFTTGSGPVTLSLLSGRSTITPGIADPGAMLDATLKILDGQGNTMAMSQSGSLFESLTLTLPAGNYYAQILSAGDPNNLGFFDMGSYFLTGSIVAVPEPSTSFLLASAIVGLFVLQRRRRQAVHRH